MKVIDYRLTLKEPAILTAIEGEPNSSVSYDFIPGSVIRGVLIGAFMRTNRISDLNLLESTLERRLFFSDQARFLNAYPAINGMRSLPVPGSWQKKKYSTQDTANQVYDNAIDIRSETDKMTNIKGFVYYRPGTKQAVGYHPKRVLNIHTQRARRYASEQQVYRYDALAPDQTFAGVILCEYDEDADIVCDVLDSIDRPYLGGARSAGYGLARFDSIELNNQWAEVDHHPDSTLILTLLSDVILRDERGQYTTMLGTESMRPSAPDAFRYALERYGISFEYGDFIALKTTLVGGFNRKWGLPLPQTPALARGSVIKLTHVSGSEYGFAQLMANGLGERRNEGFGRVALNWQYDPIIQLAAFSSDESIPEEDISLSPESSALWKNFSVRINVERVDKQFAASVFIDNQYRVTGAISPTQLARLRTKIADELRQPKPSNQFIGEFLADIKGKTAGKQFDKAFIGRDTLAEWLREPRFPGFSEKLTRNPRYQLQLIDAVLERAHKDRTQTSKETE